MMKIKRFWMFGLAGVFAACLLAGCDNEGGSLNPPTSDVSGSWLYSDTSNQQTTWALVQSDDGTIDGAATDGALIAGSLSNEDILLTLTWSGGAATTLEGTVATNVITGTYSSSNSGSGSWSAVKTN